MKNMSPFDAENIHVLHGGKFYFSYHEGRRPSWCDLKILQGSAKTLVILSQPRNYVGTFLDTALAHIATQVLNLNGLDPATTIFVQYYPPTVPPPLELDGEDLVYPLAHIRQHVFGGPYDDGIFFRLTFKWKSNEADEPMLERYSTWEYPGSELLSPSDVARFLEELNEEDDTNESQ